MHQNKIHKVAKEAEQNIANNWKSKHKFTDWMNNAKRNALAEPFLVNYYKSDNLYYSPTFEKKYPIISPDGWDIRENQINNVLGNIENSEHTEYYINGIQERVEQSYHNNYQNPDEIPPNVSYNDLFWNSRMYDIKMCSSPPFDFRMTDYFSLASRFTMYRTKLYRRLYSSSDSPPTQQEEIDYSEITPSNFRKRNLSPLIAKLDPVSLLSKPTGFGTITTVVFDTDDSLLVPVARRSDEAVRLPGRISMIPSGYLEEISGNIKADFSLRSLVLREFAEELYNHPEIINDLKSVNPVNRIMDFLDDGRADLWYTGGVINLTDTSTTSTSLLYIQSEDFLDKYPIDCNWESENVVMYDLTSESSIQDVANAKYTNGENALSLDNAKKTLRKHYGCDL